MKMVTNSYLLTFLIRDDEEKAGNIFATLEASNFDELLETIHGNELLETMHLAKDVDGLWIQKLVFLYNEGVVEWEISQRFLKVVSEGD